MAQYIPIFKSLIKMKIAYLLIMLLLSCSNANQNYTNKVEAGDKNSSAIDSAERGKLSDFIEIKVDDQYPSRTIKMEDIAEVRYVPLETTDQSLIQGIHKMATSDDKIVICDLVQNTIFIFDKDGHFINSINKEGSGPQEYSAIHNFAVNFQKEEIYICDYPLKFRILTYSFDGGFIRESKLDQKIWPLILYNYDENFLIAYDSYNMESSEKANKQPYSLINKENGQVFPLPLIIENRKSNRVMISEGQKYICAGVNIDPMIKTDDGVVISDFALDTIYKYTDHKLIPIGVRKNLGQKDLSSFCAYSSNYSFFNIVKMEVDEKNIKNAPSEVDSKFFLIDRKSSSISEVKIQLSDVITKKDLSWDCYGKDLHKSGVTFTFRAGMLMKLLKEQRLNGKLKEIASNLTEDDNPVLMIAKFKE